MVIGKDDIGCKGALARFCSAQKVFGRRAGPGGCDHAVPVTEHRIHAVKNVGFVINAQHAQAAQFPRHAAFGFGGCSRIDNAKWHLDREDRAASGARAHRYRMIKGPAKTIDNRQAKTKPLNIGGFRALKTVEFAEDDFKLVFGDARSAVPDFEFQLVPAHTAADHRTACAGIAHGVGDEVLQDTTKQATVTTHPKIAFMDLEAQPRIFGNRAEFGFKCA